MKEPENYTLKMPASNDPMLIHLRVSEDKKKELIVMRVSVQEQIDKALENLREMRGKTDAENRLNGEAAMLRIGGEPEDRLVVKQIDERQHELEIINRAIEQQAIVVDEARRPFINEVKRLNQSAYIASAKRIVEVERQLSAAYGAHKKLIDALLTVGVSSRPMDLRTLGDLDDPQSILSAHLREFQTFVPEALE